MIDANKVGNVISLCRREKGLTQDEFSARLGVTAQAVSKWERGGSLPDTSILPDIARILELSIDDMLAGVAPSVVTEVSQNKANIMERLIAEEICVEVALNLVTGDEGKVFVEEVINFIHLRRRGLALDFGVILPIVHLRDRATLAENEFAISIHGVERFRGSIAIAQVEFLIKMLSKTINDNLTELITRQMVKSLVENLGEKHSALVSEMFPGRLNYGRFRYILQAIIREWVSIRRLDCILEETDLLLDSGMSNEEIGRAIAEKLR